MLKEYMKHVKFHDKKPKVDLSNKGLSILSPSFRDSSCLHYSLLKLLMEEILFWPEVAIQIGISQPPS
jgi:hypothetical protein